MYEAEVYDRPTTPRKHIQLTVNCYMCDNEVYVRLILEICDPNIHPSAGFLSII